LGDAVGPPRGVSGDLRPADRGATGHGGVPEDHGTGGEVREVNGGEPADDCGGGGVSDGGEEEF